MHIGCLVKHVVFKTLAGFKIFNQLKKFIPQILFTDKNTFSEYITHTRPKMAYKKY